jgi:hypothetical protein
MGLRFTSYLEKSAFKEDSSLRFKLMPEESSSCFDSVNRNNIISVEHNSTHANLVRLDLRNRISQFLQMLNLSPDIIGGHRSRKLV